MCLRTAQARLIVHCVRQQFGEDTSVMLFGSRLDATARGGDVDLLVETAAQATLHQRALVTMKLEQALELPVNIVTRHAGQCVRTYRPQPSAAFEERCMTAESLTAGREHSANLLEAAQRRAHFLHATSSKVSWPLDGVGLKQKQKAAALFEALSAFNERFAKLQDISRAPCATALC